MYVKISLALSAKWNFLPTYHGHTASGIERLRPGTYLSRIFLLLRGSCRREKRSTNSFSTRRRMLTFSTTPTVFVIIVIIIVIMIVVVGVAVGAMTHQFWWLTMLIFHSVYLRYHSIPVAIDARRVDRWRWGWRRKDAADIVMASAIAISVSIVANYTGIGVLLATVAGRRSFTARGGCGGCCNPRGILEHHRKSSGRWTLLSLVDCFPTAKYRNRKDVLEEVDSFLLHTSLTPLHAIINGCNLFSYYRSGDEFSLVLFKTLYCEADKLCVFTSTRSASHIHTQAILGSSNN